MRFGAVPTSMLFVVTGFLACVAPTRLTETGPTSGGSTESTSGGATSAGGKTSAGSTGSTGGSESAGGATSAGSNTSAGGAMSAGGNSSAGGATTAGGASARGGLGGATSAGGAGGMTSAGGTTSRGGSGGTAPSAGGSAGTCTDTAPADNPCSNWKSWGQCSISYLVDNNYCAQTCGRCGSGPSAGGAPNTGGASARGGTSGSLAGGVSAGGASAGGASAGGASSSGGVTSAGGSSAVGGNATGPGGTNPQISGSNGFATRYWDCCKPSCSWTTSVPSCQQDGTTRISDKNAKSGCDGGGSAFECYDFSPWYDAGSNMSYGFAAHNGVACGACFMLQFTGEGNSGPNAGAQALKGQQMIVQAINIGGIDNSQFDLLIPGGGVGAMTAGCSAQWGGSADLGSTYGGLLAECGGKADCMKGKCQSVFGSKPALLAGCNWFTGWYSSADNPKMVYKQVPCPSQITSKSGVSG
jgi:hypothetical protein